MGVRAALKKNDGNRATMKKNDDSRAALKKNGGNQAALKKNGDSRATQRNNGGSRGRADKRSKRGKGVIVVAALTAAPSSDTCPCDPDYSEVVAALKNIYKLGPTDDGEAKGCKSAVKDGKVGVSNVVRDKKKRVKRLGLDERVTLRQRLEEEPSTKARRGEKREHDEDVQKLVREYFASTDLNNFDRKRMKMPPVLSSIEHTWLFKLMQPMKGILKVNEGLSKDFNREPTDAELANAVKMSVPP
ncbi:hypothetical protein Cni_G09395 [Canna indica]|uniref:Uncharacterized protein n=1 Tax=Canna indica TaxID=4628 RepID=A0AAQ3K2F0_9LILI|nr:hypothetical protein Cni_G09395 [Canna indica]